MPKVVFGEHRTCYRCKGRGTKSEGGQSVDCPLCEGRGYIQAKDPSPARTRNTRVTDGGDQEGGGA